MSLPDFWTINSITLHWFGGNGLRIRFWPPSTMLEWSSSTLDVRRKNQHQRINNRLEPKSAGNSLKINGWNLKCHIEKEHHLKQTFIFGFHVSFRGCNKKNWDLNELIFYDICLTSKHFEFLVFLGHFEWTLETGRLDRPKWKKAPT